MLDTIKTFLSAAKLYIYVVLAAILISGWLFDRHSQYKAGIAYCSKQLDKANAEYTERKEQENQQAKEEAVQDADKAAKQIANLEHEKQILLSKLDSKCSLSDAERVQLDATLGRLQGQ